MTCSSPTAFSSSKARRLRNAAVKKRMFDACAKVEASVTIDMLSSLSCKLETLEHTIQGKLGFLISCFRTSAYHYPVSGDVAELDQAEQIHSYLNPYAAEFQSSEQQGSAYGLAHVGDNCVDIQVSGAAPVLTKDVLLEYRHLGTADDDLVQKPSAGMDSGTLQWMLWQPATASPQWPWQELRTEAALRIQSFFKARRDAEVASGDERRDQIQAIMDGLDLLPECDLEIVLDRFLTESHADLSLALASLSPDHLHDLERVLSDTVESSDAQQDSASPRSVCGICCHRQCICGESDLSETGSSDEESGGNANGDVIAYASRVEAAVQQLASVEFFGFSEEAVRRAISTVGPADVQGIAQWLIQSGERPDPEVAARCLDRFGHS